MTPIFTRLEIPCFTTSLLGKRAIQKYMKYYWSETWFFATKILCKIPKNYKFDICYLQKKCKLLARF